MSLTIQKIGAVMLTSKPIWTAYIIVARAKVTFKLDTGAETNIMPCSYLKTLHNVFPLHKTTVN